MAPLLPFFRSLASPRSTSIAALACAAALLSGCAATPHASAARPPEAPAAAARVSVACDPDAILVTTRGTTRRITSDDLPRPPGLDAGELAFLQSDDGDFACASPDGRHVLAVGLAGAWPDVHGILFHSEDAGAHFAATPLAGDSYTDWPLGPTARIATHGDTHATIETFDPPQHHNGHRQTRYVFTTDDGGAHVKLVDTATQCFDEESHCQGG